MTKTLEHQAADLEQRLAQDVARLQSIQARMVRGTRKRDTRFKVLLGSALLYRHAAGQVSLDALCELAERGLISDSAKPRKVAKAKRDRAFVEGEIARRFASPPNPNGSPAQPRSS